MLEGYGPNTLALLKLQEDGAGLVICVDCGTTAHEALEAAKIAGLDLVVIDHHVAEPLLPSAIAVVSLLSTDSTSTAAHGGLAAVEVALFCSSSRPIARCARTAGTAPGPSPTCCSGSTSSRSARCAMSCR